MGTDDKSVIWILGHRNADQRKKIREAFQQMYKKSLISALQSELSGHYGVCIVISFYCIFPGLELAYSELHQSLIRLYSKFIVMKNVINYHNIINFSAQMPHLRRTLDLL